MKRIGWLLSWIGFLALITPGSYCEKNKQNDRLAVNISTHSEFKYEFLSEVTTDGNAKLSKYKSMNSGMTIQIAQVNGPLVGGYLALATEAYDDDGLPHTLEHLVFLGSEKYPYKGFLDTVASRCLAQGTNAWTGIDHTCYTVTAAGDEGFLRILPIYLDHLLFPTLTDSGYTTEVHHINGEGEDAGVVYAEMQGLENSGDNLCYLAMLRAIYPGHCGYKSETGGLMKNLRESTSNDKVRAYHKEFYRPENLCIIIVGMVDAEKVFEALVPVEERIMKEGKREKFDRPWQSPVPPLPESVTLEIEYPTDEKKYGLVYVGWRGPLVNDLVQVISIDILMKYLTDTSVAPFNREFVEIEDPLCSSVGYSIIKNSETCIYLYFSSVPVTRLSEIKERLMLLLETIAEGKEEIAMQRMTNLIKKKKLSILSSMENDPHGALSGHLIEDFLYGSTHKHLEDRLRKISLIEELLVKDAQHWVQLLKTYMVDGKHVIILGTPSSELSEKMEQEEKERVKKRRDELGEAGLMEKAKLLKNATAANEVPFPKEFLTSIPIPSVKSLKYQPIKRTCNVRPSEDEIQYSLSEMPCRFEVDDVQTHFVRMWVLIDTSDLPLESRMYLPLLIELLNECAINRDGKLIPYNDVVKQLAEDIYSISASLGFDYSRFFCSRFDHVMVLQMTVEEAKYETAVQWLREILYQLHIEHCRIKSTANKMIMSVPSIKENGGSVAKSMMLNLIGRPESNMWASSVFRQHNFLLKLVKQLKTDPDAVVKKLDEIRETLFKPDKMVVHLSLNLTSIKKKVEPEEAWIQKFLPTTLSPNIMSKSFKTGSEGNRPFSDDGPKGLIAGLGSTESSYLRQAIALPISRSHPDYAPLMVLNNYLSMFEGPMWRQIRGKGLAYGYGLHSDSDAGLLYFALHQSIHLDKAYKEAVDIVDSHLNGTTKWDIVFLDSARTSLMSSVIEKMNTAADAAYQSVISYARGSYRDLSKQMQKLLKRISKVTTSDMERVGLQYLKPLFNSEVSMCAVTCNPSKVDHIVKVFKRFSRNLTVVPSLDDSFMSEY